jgi:uncharacterized membrane protein
MPYGRAGIISSSIAVVIYIVFEDLRSEIFREKYLGGSLGGKTNRTYITNLTTPETRPPIHFPWKPISSVKNAALS